MLVLSRRIGEELMIGDDVRVRILSISWSGGEPCVRIGIEAPDSTNILRSELVKNGPDEFVVQLDDTQSEFPGSFERRRPRPVIRHLRRKKNEGNY